MNIRAPLDELYHFAIRYFYPQCLGSMVGKLNIYRRVVGWTERGRNLWLIAI